MKRLDAAVRNASETTRLKHVRSKDAEVHVVGDDVLKVAVRPRACLSFATEGTILARFGPLAAECNIVRPIAFQQTETVPAGLEKNDATGCSLKYAVSLREGSSGREGRHLTPIGGATCPAYLLLERCRFSLGDYLNECRHHGVTALPMRAERARRDRWGAQLVLAVFYLHSNHVHHLDVKPDNVLVDQQDDVRLADFGEAVEGRSTVQDVPPGTARYMMPVLSSTAPLTHYYLKCRDLFALVQTLRALHGARDGGSASPASTWLHAVLTHPVVRDIRSTGSFARTHHAATSTAAAGSSSDPYRLRYQTWLGALHALLCRRRRFPPTLVPLFLICSRQLRSMVVADSDKLRSP